MVTDVFRRKRQVSRVRDVMREDAVRREAQPPPAAPQPPPAAMRPPDLEHLEAEARYHRDRVRLYRQRIASSKPASAVRLRELERVADAAVERLRHARRS
jgi:hypothetical protein